MAQHASSCPGYAPGSIAFATPFADDLTPPDDRAFFLDELATGVHRWTGNHADVVAATPAVLAEMVTADDPLVASWRVDHVHLTGVRLLDLLRRVS